eukprot:3495370-Rhodomonas_salina.1
MAYWTCRIKVEAAYYVNALRPGSFQTSRYVAPPPKKKKNFLHRSFCSCFAPAVIGSKPAVDIDGWDQRSTTLAQGPMEVADVACSRCSQ